MKNYEKVYQSDALTEGWRGINKEQTWWFDTSDEYPKSYSLDEQGVPIYWDDDTFDVEETRQCTGLDTCLIILSHNNKKALVMINKSLDHVLIQGSVKERITWDDYNRRGLWAVKQHITEYSMKAVIINPKIKTLEKFKVVRKMIDEVIKARNAKKGGDHGVVEKQDTEDQTGAAMQ